MGDNITSAPSIGDKVEQHFSFNDSVSDSQQTNINAAWDQQSAK